MADLNEMTQYYPADFDPAALKKVKRDFKTTRRSVKNKPWCEMRMLWPFTVQCESCDEVMFVGTKYNAKVRKLKKENYLGIPIWQIDGRCAGCLKTIRMHTDPKNLGYEVIAGGKRFFDRELVQRQQAEELEKLQSFQEGLSAEQKIALKTKEVRTERDNAILIEKLKRLNKRFFDTEGNIEALLVDDDAEDEFMLEKHKMLLRTAKSSKLTLLLPKPNHVNEPPAILKGYSSSDDESM